MGQVELGAIAEDDGLPAADEDGQRAGVVVTGEGDLGTGGAGGEGGEAQAEEDESGPAAPAQTFHGARCG